MEREHIPPQKDSLIGDAVRKPREMTTPELEKTIDGITFGDPSGQVAIGGINFPIVSVKWGTERRMLQVIAPYLRLLTDAVAIGQLEEAIGALLVEAHYDLTRLAVIILASNPDIILGADEVTRLKGLPDPKVKLAETLTEWVEENARFEEIVNLVRAQIKQNKLADDLGKLWEPGVLHLKALRLLSTLESQVGALSPSS